MVFGPLQQRLYESVIFSRRFWQANGLCSRFPRSLPAVVVGFLETSYLWGFLLLETVVTLCPMLAKVVTQNPEQWEFLPLMLTSLYCAVGLIWAYARLSFLYITSK
jgi:alpha-1,3-glucosyltransferase